MRYFISVLFFSVSSLILSGCATLLSGEQQSLNITSNVKGAHVFINDMKVGRTPFYGKISKSKHLMIRLEKKGYETKIQNFDSAIDPTFWVNVISGGPFGSTTDFGTNSIWKYQPSTINIDLEPKGGKY